MIMVIIIVLVLGPLGWVSYLVGLVRPVWVGFDSMTWTHGQL